MRRVILTIGLVLTAITLGGATYLKYLESTFNPVDDFDNWTAVRYGMMAIALIHLAAYCAIGTAVALGLHCIVTSRRRLASRK